MPAIYRPYGEENPVKIHCDIVPLPGRASPREPLPTMLELGQGTVAIRPNPPDQVPLAIPEVSALALTGAGLYRNAIHDCLGRWHPRAREPLESLRVKLGVPPTGGQAEALIVTSGFRREYLTPAADFKPVEGTQYQHFVHLSRLLNDGTLEEIGQVMDSWITDQTPVVRQVLLGAGLRGIHKPSAAFAALAGAAGEIQPRAASYGSADVSVTKKPTFSKHEGAAPVNSEPVPADDSRTWHPFADPDIQIRFSGVAAEAAGPDLDTDIISGIQLRGAHIEVPNIPLTNENSSTRALQSRELAVFVLALLSSVEEARNLVYSPGNTEKELGEAYKHLLGTEDIDNRGGRLILPALLSAYQRKVFVTKTPPDLGKLDISQRKYLPLVTHSLAQGRTGRETENFLGWGKGTVSHKTRVLRDSFGNIPATALVLLGLAATDTEDIGRLTLARSIRPPLR